MKWLYTIFRWDKERNLLPQETVVDIQKNIFKKTISKGKREDKK